MGRIYTEEEPYVKEMARWEQFPNKFTPGELRPGRPYQFQPYPMMLYKAHQLRNGKYAVAEEAPDRVFFKDDLEWQRACLHAERHAEKCQRTVNDEGEHRRARDEGWRDTPKEAMDYVEELERMVAHAAAERHYSDSKLSEKAQAEAEAFNTSNFGHQPVIPEQPRQKRAYNRKPKPEAA